MKVLVLALMLVTRVAVAAPVKYIKGAEAIETFSYLVHESEIEDNTGDDCVMYFDLNEVTKELTIGIKKEGKMTSLKIRPKDRIKNFNKSYDSSYSHEFFVLPNQGFVSIFTKEDISDFDLELNPTGKRGQTVTCSWME